MPFISVVSLNDHGDSCRDVRWSNKALSSGSIEAHTISENYGKKISNGVTIGGSQGIKCRESPHFAVKAVSQIFAQKERFQFDIMAILVNTCNDEDCFFFVEKIPRLGGEFRKVDNHDIRKNSQDTSEYAFDLKVTGSAQLRSTDCLEFSSNIQ
jgi:hypothetical protein